MRSGNKSETSGVYLWNQSELLKQKTPENFSSGVFVSLLG
jgi:hypothetical protein